MKFKRITSAAALLLLTLPLLLVPAQAHPGDTDSSGGHTNSETGDYHYHHGYEAHAHFDIDGDGAIDCPFDFDDKTGQSSGTPSGGSAGGNWIPGSNYSGSMNPDMTHKTISRLELSAETSPALDFSEINSMIAEVSQNNSTTSDLSAPYLSIITYIGASLVCIPLTFITIWHHRNNDKVGEVCGVLLTAFFALCSVLTSWLIIWGAYRISQSYFAWSDKRKARKAEEKRKQAIISDARKKLANPANKVDAQANPQQSSVLPSASGSVRDIVETEHTTPCKHLHPDLQEGLCGYAALSADIPPSFPKPQMEPAQDVELPKPQYSPVIPDDSFITPDPEIVFHFAPGLDPAVSVHARCRDTCHYLWYETLLVRSSTSPPLSSNSTIYIWTALFYTAVKTLRSQGAVDRIYDYFREATGKFVTEEKYRYLVVMKVREVYRSIRPLLNDSSIDPRTANGRRDLWFLIAERIPETGDPQLQNEFESASQRVWQTIADVFPQAQPYPKAGDIRYSINDLPEA